METLLPPSLQILTLALLDKQHLNRPKHVAPKFKRTVFSALLCLYDGWHLGIKEKKPKNAAEAEFQCLSDFIIIS